MNFEGYEAYPTNPGETWGQSAGLMVKMVHRIHRGEELARTGYNFAGVLFNEVTYPQDRRNCLKCHRGPDGDNFKNVPNRAACGACHDHINFTTGENARSRAPHSIQPTTPMRHLPHAAAIETATTTTRRRTTGVPSAR
jgi:OmcA/MtrC family decaheme c-type cytochrome